MFGPLFMLETPWNLRHDLRWSVFRLLGTGVSFSEMAKRAALIESTDIAADCSRVTVPTLVVTGERSRDHVVPVESTLGFLNAISGATHAMLAGTGHLGSITEPARFAEVVAGFVARSTHRAEVA